jgi:hypothetical protein
MRKIRSSWPSEEFLEPRPPSFHPYIFIMTERQMPTSIAMAAAAGGGMKYINLCSGIPEMAKVEGLVQKHFADNQGNCILFGKVEGCVLVQTATEGIVLDVEGNEVKRVVGVFWPQVFQS